MCPLFSTASSQQPVPSSPPEELVPIEFDLKRDGRAEVVSLQRENKVYLSVRGVFDFLRIKNDYAPTEGILSGFFITPDTSYVIDTRAMKARVGNRSMSLLPDDVTLRADIVYLRIELFDPLFGLAIQYNPRTLKASLATQVALPVFLNSKIKRLEDELAGRPLRLKPEATFERTFSWINGGQLDYSFRQTLSSAVIPSRSFSTRITGMLIGGDAEARFIGNLSSGVDITQTRLHWRYVPVKAPLFKQYVVGDFVTSGLLSREIYGVQLTNHPANPRIFFADETLSGQAVTSRGVYMFESSRLSAVDHSASGRYNLNSALTYGVNYIDILEFGDWGETFGSTRRIAIPASLVPPGEIDYDVVVGRLRDVGDPWHGELSSQWGVTSRVTAGVRMEYYGYDNLPTKVFPDFNVTARLADHLIGEALLSPNAFLRGTLDLTLPSLVSAGFSYTDYRSVRLFNPRNAINEITGHVVVPFSPDGMRFAFDLSGTQTILSPARERKARIGLSAFIGVFSPRIATQYGWIHPYDNLDETNLVFHETEPSLRVRLPANLFVTLAAPFNHIEGSFRNFRVGVLIQPVSNLLLEFEYDRNFAIQSTFARFRLQWISPFTRVTAGVTRGGDNLLFDQSVSGSVGAVPELGEFFFESNPSRAGYGTMLIAPFIDANLNGIRDAGEPIISSARLRASTIGVGGFRLTQLPEIGWVIPRAIPYQNYVVELPQIDLENPLWIPRYRVVEANSAPGTSTYISIPVIAGGSLRGTVLHLKGPTLQEGVEFVKVTLREDVSDEELVRVGRPRYEKKVETFSTGDFEVIGVPPGKYTVSLDGLQLASLRLQGRQLTRPVTIEAKTDGDIVEGVNFILIERK